MQLRIQSVGFQGNHTVLDAAPRLSGTGGSSPPNDQTASGHVLRDVIASCALAALLLQSQSPPPEPGRPDLFRGVSLERIRRGLEEAPTLVVRPPGSLPVFRVKVVERLRIERLWEEQGVRSAFVRPTQPPAQYEFLSAVTPEEFRGATLHPVGIPVVPLVESAARHIGRALKARRENLERKAVQEEIRNFMAAREAREQRDQKDRHP